MSLSGGCLYYRLSTAVITTCHVTMGSWLSSQSAISCSSRMIDSQIWATAKDNVVASGAVSAAKQSPLKRKTLIDKPRPLNGRLLRRVYDPPRNDMDELSYNHYHNHILNRKGHTMLHELSRIKDRKIGRFSSWDTSGRNADFWRIEPGEARVLAEIRACCPPLY